jgi:Fe-S-cluster-containing dehydrogenase component
MEKCIGCELCEKVCEFLNVKARVKIHPTEDGVLIPITCIHCTDPVCVNVCPTGAVYKDRDGFVRIRQNRCIGCKLCVVACPFGVPDIDLTRGFMTKCDLCMERAREDLPPACVELCPTGAMLYGEYEKAVDKSKSRAVELLVRKKIITKEPRAST